MIWYKLGLSQIEKELQANYRGGLSSVEAEIRLKSEGANELPEGKREGWLVIFIRQFESPLIYVLVVCAVAIFMLGEVVDSLLIAVVLIFNAIVGAIQEGRAENTLLALKKFSSTSATVIRDNKQIIIPDREVVRGDIIFLHEGEKVPADARLIEANTLKVEEASITGESKPVHKSPDPLKGENISIDKQANILFKGTGITSGFGKAVVVATGKNTYLGKISIAISKIDTEIPLKRNIKKLSSWLIFGIGLFSVGLVVLGWLMGRSLTEMLAVSVSLAVSIIPEGLPVVLTLILASGVWRMARRNALVKKLQAVEALGEAKIIAVDKTGTLTRNELVIRSVFCSDNMFEVTGAGYEPKGEIKLAGEAVSVGNHPELLLAGKIAALCANARASFSEENKAWRVSGDPTEAAMYVFANKLGFDKDDLEREMPFVSEIPFDYNLKYHATAHSILGSGKQMITVVGAPETVLPLVNKISIKGEIHQAKKDAMDKIESTYRHMSRSGLRVLAFAYKKSILPKSGETMSVEGLIFCGLLGMQDSLRPEVPEAMARARGAGVKVVMITGDSKLTAEAIAREADIWREGDEILTNEDIENLSEKELQHKIKNATVFARITPEHKMKIIEAYRKTGQIVAMTGDRVNDAPSLVAADLGVAMGKIGTEVAREAADIVLLDDNFGSIISAIEEGRNMYATIQKALIFLFSTSVGQIFVILGALLLGWPMPLAAPQILWMNLVTDSLIAFAIALEGKEENLLAAGNIKKNKYLIDRLFLYRMGLMAGVMGVGGLMSFGLLYRTDITKAWTITLTVLVILQWLNGWNCRSTTKSVFESSPLANKFLVLATALAAGLHIFAVYNPFMQNILRLTPMSWQEWLWSFAVAFLIILAEELRKAWYRRPQSDQLVLDQAVSQKT